MEKKIIIGFINKIVFAIPSFIRRERVGSSVKQTILKIFKIKPPLPLLIKDGIKLIYRTCLIIILFIISNNIFAQNNKDTVKFSADSTTIINKKAHSPKKATLYSTFIPGLGQYYNKKYWKIPVIYTAFATFTYFGIYYNDKYIRIKNIYKAKVNNEEIPEKYKTASQEEILKTKNNFRKYRDWFIIGDVLVYVLNIVDANVDAHLIDFNVSDNLSFNISPSFINSPTSITPAASIVIHF